MPAQTRTPNPTPRIQHEVVEIEPHIYVIFSIRDGQYVYAEIVRVWHHNSSIAEKWYLGYVARDEMCKTTPDGMVVRCYPNSSGDVKTAAMEFSKKLARESP